MRNIIDNFHGPYSFLSNFYPCMVHHGIVLSDRSVTIFCSAEHAYQAAKATNDRDRKRIDNCETPGQAKRLGKKIECRKDWEDIKLLVMYEILMDKFTRNQKLRRKLVNTGDVELVEGNTWHDNYWGLCICARCLQGPVQGQNHLGKILMRVREELNK